MGARIDARIRIRRKNGNGGGGGMWTYVKYETSVREGPPGGIRTEGSVPRYKVLAENLRRTKSLLHHFFLWSTDKLAQEGPHLPDKTFKLLSL